MSRCFRLVGAGVLVGAVALMTSTDVASADVTGPCDGSGNFTEGTDADGPFRVDARSIGGDLVVIPRSDTVEWQGSVAGPPGEYRGSISLDLPAPFGDITIDDWSGDSETTSNSGVKDYDLPSFVPAGVEFKVVGQHRDDNGTCSGSVRLEIEGGPFDSPAAPIGLGLTAITGVGFAFGIKPLFGRGVR